jgi:hypothetical protein
MLKGNANLVPVHQNSQLQNEATYFQIVIGDGGTR